MSGAIIGLIIGFGIGVMAGLAIAAFMVEG